MRKFDNKVGFGYNISMPLIKIDKSKYMAAALNRLKDVPVLPPQVAFDKLEELGYRGQEKARKAVCLLAYRHVRRLKMIHLYGYSRMELPPHSNFLLMGPTGCGKTFLVELLFREILKLPTVIIDITGFSETGYVGDDVKTILTRLLYVSDFNPHWAAFGVVCIDEFDKLATTRNTARFDGAGTTKDVSGLGVQRELLKLLEGSEVHVPLDFNNTCYSERISISTEDIAFICCGAFSGFKAAAISHLAGIGFEKEIKGEGKEKIAVHLQESIVEDTENFSIYGFLPELIGRFNRIIALEPLSKDVLKDILISNVVDKYKKEFSLEGFELEVDDEVLDIIVEESLKKQTGARGLNSALSKYIEEAAFGLFGQKKKGKVCLKVEEGKIIHKVFY